jgi:hypothetical protein
MEQVHNEINEKIRTHFEENNTTHDLIQIWMGDNGINNKPSLIDNNTNRGIYTVITRPFNRNTHVRNSVNRVLMENSNGRYIDKKLWNL